MSLKIDLQNSHKNKMYNSNMTKNIKIKDPITKKKVSLKTLAKRIRNDFFTDTQLNNIQNELGTFGKAYNEFTGRIVKRSSIKTFYFVDNNMTIGKVNSDDKPLLQQLFGTEKPKVNQDYNNFTVLDGLSSNNPYNFKINITYQLNYEGNIPRSYIADATIEPDNITNDYLEALLNIHWQNQQHLISDGITILGYNILSYYNNSQFNIKNMELRDANPLSIDSMFNEVIENKDGKCLTQYLKNMYPLKKFHSKKEHLRFDKMKTTKDIEDFAIEKGIKLIAYDINGNVIASNYPKFNNKDRRNLVFIAYNNHLYPLKNTTLNRKVMPNDLKLNNHKDLEDVMDELLMIYKNKNVMPDFKYMTIFADKITSFIFDGTLHFHNPDYDKCLDVLTKMGLKDHMTAFTTFKNICSIIEKKFLPEHLCMSFMPESKKHIKGGFNYFNKDVEFDNTIGFDKNKAYPSALLLLDYALKLDVRTTDYVKDPLKLGVNYVNKGHLGLINEDTLYICNPKHNSILMPNYEVYSGFIVKLAIQEGVKFQIIESIQCEQTENYWKDMILDCYKHMEEADFKRAMNIYIGKFECDKGLNVRTTVDKICNDDELKTFDGFPVKVAKDFNICLGQKKSFANMLGNRKPVSILLKDKSRESVYIMMKKLNLSNADIKQVSTDAIYFNGDTVKKEELSKYIGNELLDWKYEHYKPKEFKAVNKRVDTFEYERKENNNIMVNSYAGCGKTYDITNNIIPEIIAEDQTYIVLTPSHASAREYRKLGFNVKCIQCYTNSFVKNDIPNYDVIIVDEIGMVDSSGWFLLYKLHLLNKSIICYGDKEQLLPVCPSSSEDRCFINKNFINYMFFQQEFKDTNFRNNFSSKYYESLFKSDCKFYLLRETMKHSCNDFKDAELIISYRRATRDKYNKLMCHHLGIENMYDPNTKVICQTNKLSNYGIYNKFCFTVVNSYEYDNNEWTVELDDGDETYEISLKEFEKNFEYAYARTLHSVQGDSLKSYYFPKEDRYCLDGRFAYTLISRLKTETSRSERSKN